MQSSGISIFGATFIIFLVLKLCGTIDWNWFLVTGPLWMPLALVLAFMITVCIIACVVALVAKILGIKIGD